jgi:uncharacterized membrane protein
MVSLGTLSGGESLSYAAQAVSADGSIIVGNANGVDGDVFIWDAVNGMRSLSDVLTGAGVSLGGWQLSSVAGISANGSVIVGTGTAPDGHLQAWVVDFNGVAPESSVGCLLLLSSIGLLRRRRSA